MPTIAITTTGQALLHGPLDLTPADALRVADVLRMSDLSLVNLEATVTTKDAWPTKTKTLHTTSEGGIDSLRALGFGVLTHANNHAFDLGPPGVAATRAAVERAGMRLAGSGSDQAVAGGAAHVETASGTVAVLAADLGPQQDIVYASDRRAGINPLRIRRTAIVPPSEYAMLRKVIEGLGDDRREAARAAVLHRAGRRHPSALEVFGTEVLEGSAFETWYEPDDGDLARVRAAIDSARADADIVVVALHNHHWDADWSVTPRWAIDFARGLIDAGADMIVGTGSPVLQGIAFHRGKPILAGLGNFIFHTNRGEVYDRQGVDVWTGAVCRCIFDRSSRTCQTVEVLPVSAGRQAAAPGRVAPAPVPLVGDEAPRAFTRLTAGLTDDERARVVLLSSSGR